MAGSVEERKAAARYLAEFLKEFAREEAEQERKKLEAVRSAKIKSLFGKHLEPNVGAEGESSEGPGGQIPKSHQMFLRAVVLVARGPAEGMTVSQIAQEIGVEAAVMAACIALHVHLERKRIKLLALPLPDDFWIPGENELVTNAMLEPLDPLNSPTRHLS